MRFDPNSTSTRTVLRSSGYRVTATLVALAAIFGQCDADEPIRILCYNIHYGQGTDGQYDIERLAKVINQSRPDLVALQEVDVGVKRSARVHQARRLAELTGMAVRFGPTQHYEGGLFGNAVLTRYEILDVLIHPLPYTESTPQRTTYPRGAIAVTVRTLDGQPLRFISTHFQHNVPEDRVAEAKAINRLFAKGKDSTPTLLAGDMNATPQSEPIKMLLHEWTVAIEEPPAPSAPATAPRSRIDYVFFRPANKFRLASTTVIDEPVASDHLPVFAELELLNRAQPALNQDEDRPRTIKPAIGILHKQRLMATRSSFKAPTSEIRQPFVMPAAAVQRMRTFLIGRACRAHRSVVTCNDCPGNRGSSLRLPHSPRVFTKTVRYPSKPFRLVGVPVFEAPTQILP